MNQLIEASPMPKTLSQAALPRVSETSQSDTCRVGAEAPPLAQTQCVPQGLTSSHSAACLGGSQGGCGMASSKSMVSLGCSVACSQSSAGPPSQKKYLDAYNQIKPISLWENV